MVTVWGVNGITGTGGADQALQDALHRIYLATQESQDAQYDTVVTSEPSQRIGMSVMAIFKQFQAVTCTPQ